VLVKRVMDIIDIGIMAVSVVAFIVDISIDPVERETGSDEAVEEDLEGMLKLILWYVLDWYCEIYCIYLKGGVRTAEFTRVYGQIETRLVTEVG
jgi:hypothetical protein